MLQMPSFKHSFYGLQGLAGKSIDPDIREVDQDPDQVTLVGWTPPRRGLGVGVRIPARRDRGRVRKV